ncbi:MaoC family dehydratase [Dietzia psychralcaliphila]|uniref:MaoC family dehydratase n=1 Tax=Dietzia psychralcaliphila TaxID=139021 RepID=UPI001C1DEDE2|nr:MaoC family dehydratase [Dietzia psychralcaliphila]
MTVNRVGGPYFDQLSVGQVFDSAPDITLTDGLSAIRQSIVGDRLRLPLSAPLSTAVTGRAAAVASPGLVCDLAIGQSTVATHHVKANLFYRGLRFLNFAHIGDTLRTRTEVVGLRENSAKPGRRPTGLAALRMVTTDQDGRTVLDFYRCAMLPLSSDPDPDRTVHADDLTTIGPVEPRPYAVPTGWDLSAFRDRGSAAISEGDVFASSGDVVSDAPELARLSLNIAATHHDERAGGGRRLVYGGHTIGIAFAQATRALPNIVTVLGWESCDHTGPVHEGDTLSSELTVERTESTHGGRVVHLRSIVHSHRTAEPTAVLDWRFSVLVP